MKNGPALGFDQSVRIAAAFFPDNLRPEIVRQVIENGRGAKSPGRLFREIVGRTQINGFRPGSHTIPEALLTRKVLELLRQDNERVLADLLMAWLRIEARFAGKVRRFARAQEGFYEFYDGIAAGRGIADEQALLEWVERVGARYGEREGVPSDRASLALGCVLVSLRSRSRSEKEPTVEVPETEDEESYVDARQPDEVRSRPAEADGPSEETGIDKERSESSERTGWDGLLSLAEEWPADSSDWQDIDLFVQRFQELAQDKKRYRTELGVVMNPGAREATGAELLARLTRLNPLLESLDPLDSAWPSIEAELHATTQTAERQIARRRVELQTRTKIETVVARISPILTDYRDELGFLEATLPDISCLREFIVCQPTLADCGSQSIDEFGSLLAGYREVRARHPRSRTEHQRTFEEQVAVESRLLAILGSWGMTPADGDSGADPCADPETHVLENSRPSREPNNGVSLASDEAPGPVDTIGAERVEQPSADDVADDETAELGVGTAERAEDRQDSVSGSAGRAEIADASDSSGRQEARDVASACVAPDIPDSDSAIPKTAPIATTVGPSSQAEAVLYGFLKSADFVSASWLLKGLERMGAPVHGWPSWLLDATAAAALIEPSGSDELTMNLARIYTDHPEPQSTSQLAISPRAVALAMAASSIRPGVLAPASGAHVWLLASARGDSGPFRAPLTSLAAFAEHGIPVTRSMVAEASRAVDWKRQALNASARIDEWQDKNRHPRMVAPMASKTLRWGLQQSELASLIAEAAHNHAEAAPAIRDFVDRRLVMRDARAELIAEWQEECCLGARTGSLHGMALQQIIERMGEIRELFEEWLVAVRQRDDIASASWQREQIDLLRNDLAAIWPNTIGQVVPWLGAAASEWETLFAEQAETQLDQIVRFVTSGWLGEPRSSSPGARYRSPLLLLPQPFYQASEDDAEVDVARQLLDGACYADAALNHLGSQDFASARLAASIAWSDRQAEYADFEQKAADQQRLVEDQIALRTAKTRKEVVAAVTEHSLTEFEASATDAELAEIADAREERGGDLGPLLSRLTACEEMVARQRANRSSALRSLFHDYRESQLDRLLPRERAHAETQLLLADTMLDQGKLPAAEEVLTRLERADYREAGSVSRFPCGERFRAFTACLPELEESLCSHPRRLQESLANGESCCGVDMSRVLQDRYSDIGLAFSALEGLRKPPQSWTLRHSGSLEKSENAFQNVGEDFPKQLETLLAFVGFLSPKALKSTMRTDRNVVYLQCEMDDAGQSLVRQYGSDRNGHYDILVIWNLPNIAVLDSWITRFRLQRACPIVILPNCLSAQQRLDLMEASNRASLTLFVLDEILLTFLAGEHDSRLRAAQACALPYTALQPYAPYSGGNVAPELFKGREAAIDDLWDSHGTCVVFGGRQLGKSAVLRALQRLHDDHDANHYVFYMDIKGVGSATSGRPTSEVWAQIRDALVGAKLLKPQVSAAPEALKRQILALFAQSDDLQIRVLLDEADQFLDADARAEGGFPELQRLRVVMEETNRRFKVILSGLHAVQRLHSFSNHPLAQFGDPIVIKPLEHKAAVALMVEPLEVLGLEFQDEIPLYTILSYTNSHPSLIQEFCAQLAETKAPARGTIPTSVTAEDVETIYQQYETRRKIRERFEWTIGLDERYQAIIYSIVYDQLSSAEGSRREYAPVEALALARRAWPQGFADFGPDEPRRFMEELDGLGVVVRNDQGLYRLRNGNVARALGTVDDIEARLQFFRDLPAPTAFDPASIRPTIDSDSGARSPLTLEQGGQLLRFRNSVHVIAATPALGGDYLEAAVRSLCNAGKNGGASYGFEHLPAEIVTAAGLTEHLLALPRKSKSEKTIVFATDEQLEVLGPFVDYVPALAKRLANAGGKGRHVGLVIHLSSAGLKAWMSESTAERRTLEGHLDGFITATPWTKGMFRIFMTESGMLDSESAVEETHKLTAAWPFVVEAWYQRLVAQYGSRFEGVSGATSAKDVVEEIRDTRSPLSKRFRQATGVEDAWIQSLSEVASLEPVDDLETLEVLLTGPTGISTGSFVELMTHLGVLRRFDDGLRLDQLARSALGVG